MYPRLDRQGRPWRLDSELVGGMPVDAFMWMQQPSFVLDRAKSAIPIDHEKPKTNQQAIFVPDFEVATTNSQLKPCRKKLYAFLPFRALEGNGLPAAIQQRWKASVAASRSAEWRLWFKTLDEKQQKARVQSLSQSTKDSFWARLWLEYEEHSKRRHARLIAAAARALAVLGRELLRKQTKEAQQLARLKAVKFKFRGKRRFKLVESEPRDLPGAYAEPLSAPLRPQDIVSLRLRLAPYYFHLPALAFRFATHIFSGKSSKEAVAEQKANFNSWTQESKVRRMDGQADIVPWW